MGIAQVRRIGMGAIIEQGSWEGSRDGQGQSMRFYDVNPYMESIVGTVRKVEREERWWNREAGTKTMENRRGNDRMALFAL